ncbi:MAG: adenosylcobinamide-phosphate synthase CbiB [Desulfobulbaceae bacterium]|nr:adenosylcobinamide-phosphate synthase CbiB [Desulfobulbaceae bacterium]
MRLEYQIVAALLLDLLLGDPRWLPHPVRLIGNGAIFLEGVWRRLFTNEYLAGFATTLSVLAATTLATASLLYGTALIHPWAETVCSILLIYTTIAVTDLARHARAVYEALAENNLPLARRRVGMIVGRDPSVLDESGVARATVESVAESMVDGVTAPLFFAFVAGPMGAMLYRAINTMDSTFGYKNERYQKFGWTPAKLDDLANFIPARLTGLLVPLAAWLTGMDAKNSWKIFRRDRLNHTSPNSAHTEAGVAGALGVQLGGSNIYFGKTVTKPTIGEPLTPVAPAHIPAANRLLFLTTLLAMLVGLILIKVA